MNDKQPKTIKGNGAALRFSIYYIDPQSRVKLNVTPSPVGIIRTWNNHCGDRHAGTWTTGQKSPSFPQGASIWYVRAERGGGGLKKLMISAYNSTDRLREMRTMIIFDD